MQHNRNWLVAIGMILLFTGCGPRAAITNDKAVAETTAGGTHPTLPVSTAPEAAPAPPPKQTSTSVQPEATAAEAAVPAPAIDNEVRQPASVAEVAKTLDL